MEFLLSDATILFIRRRVVPQQEHLLRLEVFEQVLEVGLYLLMHDLGCKLRLVGIFREQTLDDAVDEIFNAVGRSANEPEKTK